MILPTPSPEARGFYDSLRERGVTLYATDSGGVRFKPKSLLSSADVEALKLLKPEILSLLFSSREYGSVTSVTRVITSEKPDTYAAPVGDTSCDTSGDALPSEVSSAQKKHLDEADWLGLVARWGHTFGYIAIHDPTDGEWHDVPTNDAPDWAKNECFLRRDLRKQRGITRLLNQREIEEAWKEDMAPMWASPAPTREGRNAGLVYDDELGEER